MNNTAFDDLCQRFWHFQCDESPIAALLAGQASSHKLLLREAPVDHLRRARLATEMLAELSAFGTATLSAQQQISARLLLRELELLIDGVAVNAHLRPMIYPIGPDASLQFFAQSTAFGSVADAKLYNERLRHIPESFEGLQTSLQQGVINGIRMPKLVIQHAVATVRANASMALEDSPFFSPFKRKSADRLFDNEAHRCLLILCERVLPALHAYADFIEKVLGEAAQDSTACIDNPQGREFYRHMVREFTTLNEDPTEIHAFGLAEVARLSEAMTEVARSAGYSTLAQFTTELKNDTAQFASSGEALRQQIEVLSKRIDARMPEFFGRLPRMSYGVQSIPEAVAASMPPAYAQPNPADGSAAGIHWITSLPDRCPAYIHIPLALHEAWPGHLMHLALMQEMTELPAFRRYGAMRYSACLEGWALYCEALGEDLNLYDTPAKRYGRLEMEIWRAVRLVVDTGLHWLHWPREQALQFMLQHMAMSQATLEAEVDRYIGMPAQALGYQLGNRSFREYRARAQVRLGTRFNLRRFHDTLMSAGPASLDVLSDLVDQWVDAELVAA
nr:DUF885 domain-containing protein [uncultured Roseateles sp.]